MTEKGRQQCQRLARTFPTTIALPDTTAIELIIASPLRRTLYTAIFAFPGYLRRGRRILAHPDSQETSALPCDRGSDPWVLHKEFGRREIDFALVHEGWNTKTERYAPQEVQKRAMELRRWLSARPEREIVLVTHAGILRHFTQDGTGDVELWDNCEVRTYRFLQVDDAEANMERVLNMSSFRASRKHVLVDGPPSTILGLGHGHQEPSTNFVSGKV